MKRIPKDYKATGCFELAAAGIKECFLRNESFQEDEDKEKLQRIEFANNRDNKLIEMFCDCSNNFEPEKLRKEIIKYSTQKPKTLQERLDDLMTK